jgi:hypothetical protein
MARARNAVGKLRKIIDQWPETREKLSHGSPTWWGGKKTFATYADNHHGDGRQAVWIKSTADAQEDLVAMNDEVFFVPPYVGPSGWIGVRLDVKGSDWTIVEGLLEEGYRMVAPKRALRQLDGE